MKFNSVSINQKTANKIFETYLYTGASFKDLAVRYNTTIYYIRKIVHEGLIIRKQCKFSTVNNN